MIKDNKLKMVSVRLVKDRTLMSQEKINSPEDAVQLLADEIKTYDREVGVIINLQTDGKPINASIVSMGTINASLITPRELLKCSILSNAAKVIMLHNHREIALHHKKI